MFMVVRELVLVRLAHVIPCGPRVFVSNGGASQRATFIGSGCILCVESSTNSHSTVNQSSRRLAFPAHV